MLKGFFICILFSIFSSESSSQQDSKKNNSLTISRVEAAPNLTAKISPELLPEVLFATNEDCYLYIDDDLKGVLLKDQFRYLPLSPGKHIYRAKSKTMLDELKDSLEVAQGKTNEVFIDLLYVIDERNAEREKLKNENTVVGAIVFVDEIFESKDAEKKVFQTLAGNMVKIRGGNFVMGNNRSPLKDEAEHLVTINALFFSKYEVTQHQWETIMGYNPSLNINCPTCPVDNVSWEEVMRFIRKLNIRANKKFRLPTEAEWEYVAKLGGKPEIDTAGGQEAYIIKTAWFFANANKQTHPVGLRQPNVAGIFDLTGNVSEWCSDWYTTYFSKEDFNQLNPEGPPLGKEKVIRGGNYKDYIGDRFRPSLRTKRIPTEKGGEVGFRLVMDVPE